MPMPGLHGVIPDIWRGRIPTVSGVAKLTVKRSEVHADEIWVHDSVISVHDSERLALASGILSRELALMSTGVGNALRNARKINVTGSGRTRSLN